MRHRMTLLTEADALWLVPLCMVGGYIVLSLLFNGVAEWYEARHPEKPRWYPPEAGDDHRW